MKIKWTNKFSQETGFVKKLVRKQNCFENTFDQKEARSFPAKDIDNALAYLNSTNSDNIYEVVGT